MLRLTLPLMVLFLAGCSMLTVVNSTDGPVTVQVEVPGRKWAVTRRIRGPDGASDFISEHGGSYNVGVIPDERYLSLLKTLRAEVSGRLFIGASLNAQEVEGLVRTLNDVDRMLEQVTSSVGPAFCRGRLPEMESATAVITFNASTGQYHVSCG
ncbi:MAG: hypothetical protein HKO65_06560 [Gemmatimonadetes bacterium]|nr:hypothetical protein [Gemmatimonadota bacterium]NNM04750.1 hypothetical protein [Gemmatimonadota bacterium]